MRIRSRQIVLGCLCLLAPLAIVALSGASVYRASAASALPSYGSQPAPSIFGIDSYTIDNNRANFLATFPTAKNLGGRWLHFTAGSIHWSNGQPSYAALDFEVTRARKLHMGVLISLGGASSACSVSYYKQSKPTHCPPTTAADLQAYKSFLTGELLRYRNDVTYYESWTEPNHSKSWQNAYPASNAHPNPKQYAALLQAQYEVFQSVNRKYGLHLKLLFGGSNEFSANSSTPGVIAILPFTHQVLGALGGAQAFDGIALHAYVYPPNQPPPNNFYTNVTGIPAAAGSTGPYPAQGCVSTPYCQMTWSQQLSAYVQEFANAGYSREPLWLTEFGWPGNASANGPSFPSYSTQAQNLRGAYDALLKLPFVQAAFWYNLYDYKTGIPSCKTSPNAPLCNPDPAPFAHYGLLNYNQSQKPAVSGFTALAKANPNH